MLTSREKAQVKRPQVIHWLGMHAGENVLVSRLVTQQQRGLAGTH